MEERIFGYVRVSTRDQNEARQLLAMEHFGVPPEGIVVEKLSGKDFRRPAYLRLLKRLRPGDTLVVKSIDRLGRNYEEILRQWRQLTQDRQVRIVVLDMPLLDTRPEQNLTGVLIADITLQLLSYMAQTERESIRQRQQEGIAAAKARGEHLGRPIRPLPPAFLETARAWRLGECSGCQAAARLRVSRSYFYQKVKELGV